MSNVTMSLQDKSRAVSRVLIEILVLNILVAVGKIVVGVMTGTIAIIADGLHSTTDASANIIGLVGQRLASLPPDDEHPYGHQKYETLATLAIGGLLLVAAWEVLKIAVDRLLNGGVPEIGVAQFGILAITLLINIGVANYERRAAHRLGSKILEADAQHTATDIWVTISALASLVLVKLGFGWMDAAIGLLIVGVIGRAAWHIIRDTSTVLVDAAPLSAEELTAVIDNTPGINKILRARSRGADDSIQVDLDVEVPSVISAELAQNIAAAVQDRVRDAFPHITEVRVQITADDSERPNYLTIARAAADSLGLGVHEIIGVSTANGKSLEMHVEVAGGSTLREAHRQIDQLEHRISEQLGGVNVVTHIEPQEDVSNQPTSIPEAESLRPKVLHLLHERFPQAHWHEINIRRDGRGYGISMHCHLPGDISIENAHSMAEEAELLVRATFRDIHRVTIHTEPGPHER